jgi:hypothetical protein
MGAMAPREDSSNESPRYRDTFDQETRHIKQPTQERSEMAEGEVGEVIASEGSLPEPESLFAEQEIFDVITGKNPDNPFTSPAVVVADWLGFIIVGLLRVPIAVNSAICGDFLTAACLSPPPCRSLLPRDRFHLMCKHAAGRVFGRSVLDSDELQGPKG